MSKREYAAIFSAALIGASALAACTSSAELNPATNNPPDIPGDTGAGSRTQQGSSPAAPGACLDATDCGP